MLAERLLTTAVSVTTNSNLNLQPVAQDMLPGPDPNKKYMLYMHIPFCTRLCPYCSFNRFPFSEQRAVPYFESLRKEMYMLKDIGYDFDSMYIGGGTPTVMIDELCDTIDLAKSEFSIAEVSSETNPNHLTFEYLEKLKGRVDRLSVGVQSFDNGLLKQMHRYDKYGSGEEILESLKAANSYFKSLNADFIFNFPAQTEEILRSDLAKVIESGVNQTTFYPLMASPSVAKSLKATVGKVDYNREHNFYEIICKILTEGANPKFTFGSAWTFNSIAGGIEGAKNAMIDEYVVDYEEYPAIGSGGITYLSKQLFVNTFSLKEYSDLIQAGKMSISATTKFSKKQQMRYRFMMQLFGLSLDKAQFEQDFGCTVERGLAMEMLFMKLNGAFEIDNDRELRLSKKGRYLMVVMMRQFFVGVNTLRDQSRASLTGEERQLIFS